jgi:hypothetical protein
MSNIRAGLFVVAAVGVNADDRGGFATIALGARDSSMCDKDGPVYSL